MSLRDDVAPDTLGVDLGEDGVTVEYLDGREVFYRGVPRAVEGSVRSGPGKDVHVLVTDETETRGVLTYVNDRTTAADILAETGVGRVIVEDGTEQSLFPGVDVAVSAHRVTVSVDFDVVDGRVFVFLEDDLGEDSVEVVPPGSE
ncbi:hypothetical protein BRC64_09720 [Halobacteriales archaeon QH_10_67_22]|nr:MAG: hypothetical protein BRC64_09720 [Halobacteriales archaeon QH_10_67_22]